MSYKKLKYSFPGFEKINATFSMSLQDIFVCTVLDGKKNGTYLEIGAYKPIDANNTYLLKQYFDWNGISIDYDEKFVEEWKTERPNNTFLLKDALTIDYDKLLTEHFTSNEIDYLQVDIEPSENTLKCLKRIPLDKFRFKVITFETDVYVGGNGSAVREEQRNLLNFFGYELVVGDVLTNEGSPYEDWWVDPEQINKSIVDDIKNNAKHTQFPARLLLV